LALLQRCEPSSSNLDLFALFYFFVGGTSFYESTKLQAFKEKARNILDAIQANMCQTISANEKQIIELQLVKERVSIITDILNNHLL